ncbi:MAG: hypothetical protein U1B30_01050 [Pseudomonadota bacterium]|nr:hypothetical protein [Pseudomonadota bacterium]
MTTTKWIISIIAASAISSYATFHLNQPNQNELDAASNIENLSHLKFSNINSTEQRHELEKKTDSARDNCEINLNQTALLPADTGANNPNQAQPARIEDLQFAYEQKQNKIASFREFIERTGDSSLSVISDNYDSEQVDPVWARSKEDELLALLDTNETLQNTAPLELSCKSQNCRLILSAHDGSQGESLYSAFKNEVLQGSDENKKQVISYFRNPDSGEIHIYLSKNNVDALLDGKRN